MSNQLFTPMEIDAIGEIMNISLGSSATAVSNLLDHRVAITTPSVSIVNAEEFTLGELQPAIGVEIKYVAGLNGSNIMLLKMKDIKIIVDILMGMETPEEEFELNELTLSAVCEVMNQMMGASSTALSDFLGRVVNISTPQTFDGNNVETLREQWLPVSEGPMVVVQFALTIEGSLQSEFMNVMSVDLAKELVSGFGLGEFEDSSVVIENSAPQSEGSRNLSQAEIEALLAQSSGNGAPAEEPQAPSGGGGGVLSQEEIEKMLAGGAAAEEPQAPSGGGGVLSQEEIEKMLAGGAAAEEPQAPSGGGGGVLSQEEIEKMLAGGAAAEEPQPPSGGGGGGVLSQEEIEKMLAGGAAAQEPQPAVQQPPVQQPPVQQPPVQQPPVQQPPAQQPPLQQPQQPAAQFPPGYYPPPYGWTTPDGQPMPYPMYAWPPNMPVPQQQQQPMAKKAPDQKLIHTKTHSIPKLEDGTELNEEEAQNLDLIMGVPLEIAVEIGRTEKKVQEILALSKGSLVVLDKLAGDQVDVYVNGKCIAVGDVVVIDDNFGIRITEILHKPGLEDFTL